MYVCLYVKKRHYFFSCESVVLGGTHQENDHNTKVCPNDKIFIGDGCRKIIPGLEHAQYLYDWVGLRPGRGTLRLEAENRGHYLRVTQVIWRKVFK